MDRDLPRARSVSFAAIGDRARRRPATANPPRAGALRPGLGLLIGAVASIALWAGLAKLAVNLLH